MRRLFLLASLSLASCNAINGLSDFEKVECVEDCGPAADATFETDPVDTAIDTADTAIEDTTAPEDTADGSEVAPPDVAPDVDDGAADSAPVDTAEVGCTSGTSESCYSGPSGTESKGACRNGTRLCVDGVFGPCVGQVVPTPETCNGVDDDCNGTVDDAAELGNIVCGVGACKVTKPACAAGVPAACAPTAAVAEACDGIDNDCDGAIDEDACTCIFVAPTGNDINAGTATSPMRTINAAITKALTGPKRVCVASGAACPSTLDYAEAVVMKNGVSVYGGYQSTTWTRSATCTSRIVAQNARGAYFDATVTTPTILDGFTVTGRTDATNAAITIEGSTGAVVNNVVVLGGSGSTSIGIDVLESGEIRATPTISRSAISGGTGTALAIGVRANRSSPVLQDNCSSFDSNGRCNLADACAGTLFIRGRTSASTSTRSYGVSFTDAPRAAITRTAVCSGGATTETNGVRLAGDLTLVRVSNSSIHAQSATLSVGAFIDACADGAPTLFNNFEVSGETAATSGHADGVRVSGDCHARIDSNVSIVGSESSSTTADVNGVFCTKTSAGKGSRCTVTNNATILGSSTTGIAATTAGVRCDDGACSKIDRNTLISGTSSSAASPIGVYLAATGTLVSGTVIESGCATKEGVGLFARDAFARIENSVLRGSSCPTASTAASFAMRVLSGNGPNEVDVHSSTLFGLGSPGAACISRALSIEAIAGAAPTPHGVFRNLILLGGPCSQSYVVEEASTLADPRVFRNNDLWPLSGTAVYRDEAGLGLNTIADINALTDGLFSANIAADPGFTSGYKLSATSACRDVGTMEGAPVNDIDRDVRPIGVGFDIGADEHKP